MPVTFYANFSPYHDPDPINDFFDDDAQRITAIIGVVLAIHIAIVFSLSTNFIVPDLKEDEPEVVPVQIVAFEEVKPVEETPPPPVEEIQPAIPAPATAPRPKPKPRPQPTPQPTPPPPAPIIPPTPEPEPEPTPPPPPPPEILQQEAIEPEPEALPDPIPEPVVQEPIPEPVIPEPVPEPIPDPIVEIFEPEPIPEPAPLPEPIPEPIQPEPEPIIEIFEPEPIIEEPLPDPIIEKPLPEPVIEPEPAPFVTPQPTELPPTPGPVIEEELPDLPPLEELPPLPEPEPVITQPEPAPTPTIEPPEVEVVEPETPIITTAPSILASPEAPTTPQESETAVPQSQSDPFLDLLKKERPLTPGNPGAGAPRNPAIAGPTTGGGNINTPPGGGTRRGGPGASGWTLAPGSYGNSPGEGYEGLTLDIRCREAGKTHLECPEYLRRFQGRDRTGFESFNGIAGRGTDTGPGVSTGITRRSDYSGNVAGGQNIWKVPLGDNSFNGGGPSTTILDDGPEVDFSREFRNNPVRQSDPGSRVRDMFEEPEEEDDLWALELLPPPEE